MAKVIKSDGTFVEVKAVGKRWSLKELQTIVGGEIERMTGIGPTMLINEDGISLNLPVNLTATQFVRTELLKTGRRMRYDPMIRGDVVVLDRGEQW